MRRSPFLAIGDLASDEEDRLGAVHLDCLRIHWGVIDARRGVLFDFRHRLPPVDASVPYTVSAIPIGREAQLHRQDVDYSARRTAHHDGLPLGAGERDWRRERAPGLK